MKGTVIEILPVPVGPALLLNGQPYTVDRSGSLAITPDGKAIRLVDPVHSHSRFK